MDLNELYRNEGLGFLLSRIQMKVHKPIFAYEDITVNTWCTESKSYAFMRYFDIWRGGEKVAECPIVAAEDVERIGFFGIFGRLAGSLVGL